MTRTKGFQWEDMHLLASFSQFCLHRGDKWKLLACMKARHRMQIEQNWRILYALNEIHVRKSD